MPLPVRSMFVGGSEGAWRVERLTAVAGEGLPAVARLAVIERPNGTNAPASGWCLQGVTGHIRYTKATERDGLAAKQQGLGRPEATRAALIPIRKSEAWWDLAQDERRAIFEERSRHIAIGLDYLPAVARRLYHARDLGEKFDFLTWFEYAPEHTGAFDELLRRLRETEEWAYTTREVEIRLARDPHEHSKES